MTTVPLTKPARSVLDGTPDNLKAFIVALADKVAQGANWMVRKKSLCDCMLSLDAYLAMGPEERRALAAAGGHTPPEEEDAAETSIRFGEVLPLYVAGILESLGEEQIASAGQAAAYIMSIHPEHQAAAEAWMLADPKNAKAVRKVVRGDRRFAALLKATRTPGGNVLATASDR